MSNQYTRPLASFWVALVLASAYMVPIIAALAKVPAALSGPGFLAIIFPPLLLAEPLAVVLIVVFVYLRKKFAIIAMMVGIPLAVPSFLAGIDQIVFHEDHVGANLGYGFASSLAITGYLAALAGIIALTEYIAYKDLKGLRI